IAAELDIPHIHTPHSLGVWKREDMGDDPETEAAYRFKERIDKEFLIFRQADRVIATTPQQREMLTDRYELPPDRVAMIPPGVDQHRYFPVPERDLKPIRKRLGFRNHDVYTIGRAAANKGYDLLIRALPTLRS